LNHAIKAIRQIGKLDNRGRGLAENAGVVDAGHPLTRTRRRNFPRKFSREIPG
jgi:hypothetical protein